MIKKYLHITGCECPGTQGSYASTIHPGDEGYLSLIFTFTPEDGNKKDDVEFASPPLSQSFVSGKKLVTVSDKKHKKKSVACLIGTIAGKNLSMSQVSQSSGGINRIKKKFCSPSLAPNTKPSKLPSKSKGSKFLILPSKLKVSKPKMSPSQSKAYKLQMLPSNSKASISSPKVKDDDSIVCTELKADTTGKYVLSSPIVPNKILNVWTNGQPVDDTAYNFSINSELKWAIKVKKEMLTNIDFPHTEDTIVVRSDRILAN